MNRIALKLPATLRALLAAILFVCAGAATRAQAQTVGLNVNIGKSSLQMLRVQGNVYMIAGAGANITVQVGEKIVIVVDSGTADKSDEIVAAIKAVTDKHIMFIIDTSEDEDHTAGNGNLSKAGWTLPNAALGPMQTAGDIGLTLPAGASIVAHINVLGRMSETANTAKPVPSSDWPTDPYDTDEWKLYNGEGIVMFHPASAHTDTDSIVYFRKSDVISAGDILNLVTYPVIDLSRGGSIGGEIDALNQIVELLIPVENEEGGTYVIPGHGRIMDRNDVVNYRDMVTIIRDRVQAGIDDGKTLEQIEAAKPTLDYDGLYGATTGPWTTNMFIEAIYKDLSKAKTQAGSKMGGGK
jgi:glyoxylase-like metal-dependent hydrolase (beta-lactamase superfamily II)